VHSREPGEGRTGAGREGCSFDAGENLSLMGSEHPVLKLSGNYIKRKTPKKKGGWKPPEKDSPRRKEGEGGESYIREWETVFSIVKRLVNLIYK